MIFNLWMPRGLRWLGGRWVLMVVCSKPGVSGLGTHKSFVVHHGVAQCDAGDAKPHMMTVCQIGTAPWVPRRGPNGTNLEPVSEGPPLRKPHWLQVFFITHILLQRTTATMNRKRISEGLH